MSRRNIFSFLALAVILFFTWQLLDPVGKDGEFSERVKIALRDAGNQLLLTGKDSTSLILPVVELERSKYRLAFEKPLSFEPSSLVSVVKKSFHTSGLPRHYRVEVIQCSDEEVAYSYEIKNETESDIIPCAGRFLPESCYVIEVRFTNRKFSFFDERIFVYILIILVFLTLLFVIRRRKRISKAEIGKAYSAIGSFQFYPEQNKLVKAAIEISLSKKECELLAIFAANPNQIIKRDELTKKVWEDNNVFVGRSLDTYISKLRKKLKADSAIKLTNVHGIGYKLEVDN